MNAGSSPLKTISTADAGISERREFWQANAVPLFGRLELEPQSRQAFQARCEHARVADLLLCRLSTSVPHRIIRTDAAVRQDEHGYVKAVLQAQGCSIVEQSGRRALLRPGEWSVYDANQPYSVAIPDRAELYIVMMPRGRISAWELEFHRLFLRRLSGRRGLGKLIWSLIFATLDQIPEIQNHSNPDVADIITQMFRLALSGSSNGCASASSKETLRERVKSYISSHLGDPELSITRLATVTGCTKRYLHMVFQQESMSISDYIRKLRLERCRKDLLDPAYAHRSITDIAYSWGFNNSNHFSRCFRDEFGVSPRLSRSEFAERFIGTEKHLSAHPGR